MVANWVPCLLSLLEMPSVFPNEKVFDVQEKNSNVTNSVTKKKGLIIEKKILFELYNRKKVCIIRKRGSNSGPFKWQKQTNKIYYVFFHPLDFMKHYKQEWIEKEKLFCKNNTQITVWQRKMKTQFLCVWHVKSFKRYLLLWKELCNKTEQSIPDSYSIMENRTKSFKKCHFEKYCQNGKK